MVEQRNFPAYRPENPKMRNNRVSLMLTYSQVLMIASALRLLDSMIHEKNPVSRLFSSPLITEEEFGELESIHNSCINCALGQEAYSRSKEKTHEE